MLTLQVTTNGLSRSLLESPEILQKRLHQAVLRSVKEIARDARRRAPKAFTTLTDSINHRMVDPLTGEAGPHVDYARMVEEGTGPGGYPPLETIQRWIDVKNITPRDPDMTERDLSFAIARSIAVNGTPANPYLIPALNDNKARAQQLIDQAIDRALQEIAGR